MLKPYRLSANGNGETKCIIFVDSIKSARQSLEPHMSVIVGAYPFIKGFGAIVNVHKLEDLEQLPCVEAIAPHSVVTTTDLNENKAFRVKPCEYVFADSLHSQGYFGQNVSVAVIDTGFTPHVDFLMPKNRGVFVDFVAQGQSPYDDNGHGTAVSSILCGNGLMSGGVFKGVAPKARLISLKSIGKEGSGGAFAILEAMQWIFTNKDKFNIKVVCMSFGTDPSENGVDALMLGAEALWQSGITVVASAGNDGPKSGTIKSPGISPRIITVGGAVIKQKAKPLMGDASVSGMLDKVDISIADFSSRGPVGKFVKPDIVAPSVDITCCGVEKNYTVFSGTSMAAPIVAGAAALLLSKNPDYSPDRIKELLLNNAFKLHDIDVNAAGRGFLQIAD